MQQVGKLTLAVLLVAVLGAGGYLLRHPLLAFVGDTHVEAQTAKARPKESSDPSRVDASAEVQKQLGLVIAPATVRAIVERVEAPGTAMFDEKLLTHLRPRTRGRVLSLAVQPGDTVAAGETLATLDASGVLDASNGVATAKASLFEAQSMATGAKLALKRGTELLKIGGISQAELERRQVEQAKAEASVQTAEAKLEMYQAQYQRLAPEPSAQPGTSAIVSPIAGVVTASMVTIGEVVDTTQDAFTVADPARMIVKASLYGASVETVRPGDPATIEIQAKRIQAKGWPALDGHVASVNASLEPVTNAATARIEVANPDRLLKGNMFVTTRIMADLGRRGVTIPASAVQQTEQGKVAFVRTAATRFERRILTLGLQRSDWVEVEKGVAAGEPVVTKGSFGLKAILLKNLLGATD